MERIYPAYADKVKRNNDRAKEEPETLANRLNFEYGKLRNSKAKSFTKLDKLPVRLYGSGDFIPEHLEVLKKLDFKFFMISKSLTSPKLYPYIDKLLALPNLTTLRLSFDNSNMDNYAALEKHFGQDRIGFAFTGLPDGFQAQKDDGYAFDVFFNIAGTKAEKIKAREHKESCPVDTGALALQAACTTCNRCWKSSTTKGKTWNNQPQTQIKF